MLLVTPREIKSRRPSMTSTDGSLLIGSESAETHRQPYTEGNLKVINSIDCGHLVMCVRFNASGDKFAVGLSDGGIQIYSTDDPSHCLYSLKDDNGLPVTSIRFVPHGPDTKIEHTHILVCTYASGHTKMWHFTSQSLLYAVNEKRQVLCLSFNAAGTRLVTGGSDAVLHLYDWENKSRIATLEASDSREVMNGHRSRIFAVQYHPSEAHHLVSGGWDDTVQFWDERSKHATRRIYGPHLSGDALDIDASHNHILTGSWRKDNTLQIWDYRNGEKIKDVPQDNLHGSLLYSAQWLGKEHIICGGSEQNMCRIIDRGTLNTVGQLVDLPKGVYCIDNDRQPHRQKIIIGSATKVYVLRVEKKQP